MSLPKHNASIFRTTAALMLVILAMFAGIEIQEIDTTLQSAEFDVGYAQASLSAVAKESGSDKKLERASYRLGVARSTLFMLGHAAWIVAFLLSIAMLIFDQTPRVFRILTVVSVVASYLSFFLFRPVA